MIIIFIINIKINEENKFLINSINNIIYSNKEW
jgi:hypothetical protein